MGRGRGSASDVGVSGEMGVRGLKGDVGDDGDGDDSDGHEDAIVSAGEGYSNADGGDVRIWK